MNKCRWCDLVHGPMCPAVKALEYADDGVTVRRVEFKVVADYCLPMAPSMPAPWGPTWSGGIGGSTTRDVGHFVIAGAGGRGGAHA